jgi:hypothetical protein
MIPRMWVRRVSLNWGLRWRGETEKMNNHFLKIANFRILPLLFLFSLQVVLLAQSTEEQTFNKYSTGHFVEILKPFQTGDYAVGILAKGKLADVVTNFGQLANFHVFSPALEWPAFGDGQDDQQQYGWGVDFMMGINGDVIESFQDPASNIISRDWQPADENLFSGNVTVSETDLTPIMATSDNVDTWPIGSDGKPFWPGLFRKDLAGTTYPGQFTSERDLFCVFDDQGNDTPYGIRVKQTAYSFSRRYAEDFLVYRFNIKNTSSDTPRDLYPGMMVQFLIDFDNHDLINFIDSNGDGKKDLIYMWDTDMTPQEPWSKVGYIGLVVINTPHDNGITNFHFFHDDFTPSRDQDYWMLLTSDTTNLPDTTQDKYFHGADLRIDDVSFAPALDPDGNNNGAEITWAFSTGPATVAPGDSVPFEIAIVCGDNEQDLLDNVDWVWYLEENAWNGPNPPNSPQVNAYGGDGKVNVVWDAQRSENSRDNLSGVKDFEGYKVYRSVDRGKTWGKTITDSRGNFIGFQPLAQFDLKDGITGNDPISNKYLGSDSGIRHTYVDTTVTNGIEYWYSVTAYDADSLAQVESLESALGLTTAEINVDDTVPSRPPSNLTAGTVRVENNILQPDSGFTDAEASIEVIDPAQLKDRNYKINFRENVLIYEDTVIVDTVTTFTLRDADTGDTLLLNHRLTDESGDNIPIIDGFRLSLKDTEPGISFIGWTKVNADSDTCTFYWSTVTIGANDPIVVYSQDDFKIVIDTTSGGGLTARYYDLWAEQPTDSSTHLPLKIYRITDPDNPIDVSENTWLGEFITSPFGAFTPPGWDLVPGGKAWTTQFPYPDRLIVEYIPSPGDTSGLRLLTNNGPASATPPSQGDEFTIKVLKPFTEKVVYTFSTTAGQYKTITGNQLEKIRVVPNPYFVSSSFDNRVMFTNLPDKCDIKIFNVAGDLIKTLRHSGVSGSSYWDLKNEAGLAIAYGLYVYVINTDNGEKHIGKFSVVR